MRKVIYTCLTGAYDSLRQPSAVDGSFDYVCFSDSLPAGRDGLWEVRPMPSCTGPDGPELHGTRLSRYPKILPHKVLPEYDISVYMDANLRITGKAFYDAVDAKIDSGCLIAQVPHLGADCVYDEVRRCHLMGKMSFSEAVAQKRYFKSLGFPRHVGMFENNVIFRRHRDPSVISVSEAWWKEYMAHSRRDQLALAPVYHAFGLAPELLFGEGLNSRNVPFVEYSKHPGELRLVSAKGLRRFPLKVLWTWRLWIGKLFLA